MDAWSNGISLGISIDEVSGMEAARKDRVPLLGINVNQVSCVDTTGGNGIANNIAVVTFCRE